MLTRLTCSSAGGSTFSITGSGDIDDNASFQDGDNAVEITLASGDDTASCTFENTELGTIIVAKETLPNGDTTPFVFTGEVNASLADGDSSEPIDVLPGSYEVAETVSDGWDLTDIQCSDSDSATPSTSNSATATFNVDPGETVSCTFTNTKRGTIDLTKLAVGGDSEFDFTEDTTGSVQPFDITTVDGTANPVKLTAPGNETYTIIEAAEDGWDLTNIECGAIGTTAYNITNEAGDDATPGFDQGDDRILVDLAAGDAAGCTFTNTKRGTIVIEKATVGGDGTFGFTDNIETPNSFSLSATTTLPASTTFENVLPNVTDTYAVAEDDPTPGWDLTGLTCVDSVDPLDGGTESTGTDGVATINLDPGELVTCTFTNTKRGSIVIVKDAVDNNAQDFAFTTTGDGLTNFTLDDDTGAVGENTTYINTETFEAVVPGVYTVTETPVDGWVTTIVCVDSVGAGTASTGTDGVATINVDPGETVTCTYTNTDVRGSIVIVKDAVDNNAQDFAFTTTGDGLTNFTLDDDTGAVSENTTYINTETFEAVVPGVYTVTETPVDGWVTTIVCVDSVGAGTASTGTDGVATINVDPGETVTCTYTNTDVAARS